MEFFSLRNNDKKISSNQKDILNIRELISKLDIMFEEELSKNFKDIMNIPKNIFLNIIISEVKNFLDIQYGDEIYKNEKFINFFSSSCNNLEDKYKTYLDELTNAWNDYESKNKSFPENFFYFSNFRKHCINSENFAMHKCSEGKSGYFISVIKKQKNNNNNTINNKKKNSQNLNIQYLICSNCKSAFFVNKFINYCKECNTSYLCSILSHNEDPDLLLATWARPHCETLVNEKIKCNKCKDNCLYLNMKLNKLQCNNKSCSYNETLHNIEWICNICNKIFYSNVKVYNPVEVQLIKEAIKLTLLVRKKAHPIKVSCCKNINVLTENFFHKKECKGLLYLGDFNNKAIVVCDKCKAINFLVKFIWTCPKCGSRFKDKGTFIKDENNRKFFSPIYDNRRTAKEQNILNENENKKEYNNINNNRSNNSNSNINKRNKETLLSMLKRKNEQNEDKNLKNNNNNTEINNLNWNIYNKKEINDKSNSPQINDLNKFQKMNIKNNNLEKSFTEFKNSKDSTRRSSFINGVKDPIKEECETKFSSPVEIKSNNFDIKEDKFSFKSRQKKKYPDNIQSNYKRKIDDDKCLSPKTNNSVFNNYLKYSNINSNNKENIGNKIFVSYFKKQNNEDNFDINNNKNNIEKENNKNEDSTKKDTIYKNINSKRSFAGRKVNKSRRIFDNEEKENIIDNNINSITINPNINKREILIDKNKNFDIESSNNYNCKINNEENEKNIKNTNSRIFSSLKSSKNEESIPNSVNTSKYLFYKAKKSFISNEKNNSESTSIEKDKTIYKRNKINENKDINGNEVKKDNRKKTYINKSKNDLTEVQNIKNSKYQERSEDKYDNKKVIERNKEKDKKQKENIEKNQKIMGTVFVPRYRFRTKDKKKDNDLRELNKSEDEIDKNKIENSQNKTNNIPRRKRRLIQNEVKNLKYKELEDENNDKNEEIIEKKTVKSRKETLRIREMEREKEREKQRNVLLNEYNEKENDKKDNSRYKHYAFESRQESYKTKENTLSRYTKDSEISSDKNKYLINRFSGDQLNIKRYKENNDKGDSENNNNDNGIELRRHYHTKKSRKDYINNKQSKNTENIIKDSINNEINSEQKQIIFRTKNDNRIRNSHNGYLKDNLINEKEINFDEIEDIPIFDKEIRKDRIKYNELQKQLKLLLYSSNLPKFNIDFYVIKNQIGVGTFGVIFQAYNIKTRCKYALKKIIAPDLATLKQFEKGFELVHQNPHPNILDLIGICIQCVDLTNFVFYVLMDLAEEDWDTAINNRQKIKKYYFEEELISILKQLTSALYYLQKEKKIAHRDIKPENVLIFKNDIYKIGDFGEAKESKQLKQLNTLRGTELYMSPLLYNGLHENKEDVRHNPFKSDMFSLGYCFIYAASLNLNIIYKIRDVNSVIILRNILMKEFNGRYSEQFINLILKMTTFSEDKRIDFIDLEKILREDF